LTSIGVLRSRGSSQPHPCNAKDKVAATQQEAARIDSEPPPGRALPEELPPNP